ncbi:MAG: O-antigen ligase family protein [Pseudobdellovibrionaceae bacterium]
MKRTDTIQPAQHYMMGPESRFIPQSMPAFLAFVWVFYLLISPFYIFESGLPQPGDMLLVVGIIPAVIIGLISKSKRIETAMFCGASFAGLAFMVNMIYYSYYPYSETFLLTAAFYVYNFLVFYFVVFLFKRSPILMNQITYFAVTAIILFQLFYVLFFPGSGIRHLGTFNNPNQLAYWSLLMACIIIVLKRSSSLNLLDMFLFGVLAYLQTQSLSKAGLVTFGMLVVLMAFSPVSNRKVKSFFLLMLSVGIVVLLTAPEEVGFIARNADYIERATLRLEDIGQDTDDSADVRGYSRLIEYPGYLLTGAGEGAYERFASRREIHSGVANLLFSYGIFGTLLFCAFLYFVFHRLPIYYGLLLLPIITYGLTHQNFRDTYFWIFLACAYSYVFFKEGDATKKKDDATHRLDYFIKPIE